MIKFILCISFFLLTNNLQASGQYHRVPAKNGDTPESLLERYGLAGHSCNLEQFLKLNDLGKNTRSLKGGVQYVIPVLIYSYNGRSIMSTLNLKDWKTAERIKEYNEMLLDKKLRQQSLIDSRILWVPYHEINCREDSPTEYKEATSTVESNESGNRKFPIFGKDYEHVPLLDESMKGKVFYIVSGHGGYDPGAVGKNGRHLLCEDEYAYDVCLRLARRLLERGAVPYMIIRDPDDGIRAEKFLKCDQDEYCWGNKRIPRGQKAKLWQRSNMVNTLYNKYLSLGIKDQYVITIHIDYRSSKQRTDVFFYHKPGSKAGEKLAKTLQKTMKKNYQRYQKGRGYRGTVSGRDLHMLREIKPTSVFIELETSSNSVDQQRLILQKNRQYLADWLFDGLRTL